MQPTLTLDGLRAMDLRAAAGPRLARLPYALRIVLENVLRGTDGPEREAHRAALLAWADRGTSDHEVAVRPARLLMHDTTCGPALVDIAGMRDALAEAGLDPRALGPLLPVDVSVDHSVTVDRWGAPDAAAHNMAREAARNRERFRLMRWAERLGDLRVHPPGTGILHSFNMEQLATVVREEGGWLVPDTLIGTDSHTPMVNALGVLAWGVGGLEAEGVMMGLPVVMRLPDVVGLRLTGRLREGVLATDLALLVTHLARARGIAGQFLEFTGPGLATLSAGERGVVANMAPEMGAQTAFFPVDARTLDYLRATGRPEALVARVEAWAKATGLWHDPAQEPRFTDLIEMDLAAVGTRVAGPRRPQDLLEPKDAGPAVARLARAGPSGAVAIAAIASCTNTTDPRLLVAAGLLARKARARGLRPPPHVKTSLSPGSPAAGRYLARAGLLADLEALGFAVAGYGCMTCIGNSGALTPAMEQAARAGQAPVAVLSGNRNFPGRVHPLLDAGLLASPPLVVAYALKGDVRGDILRDPLGTDPEGRPVTLADLWPTGAELDAALAAVAPADFPDSFAEAHASPAWAAVEAPATDLWPWDPASTYLRRPPFTEGPQPSRLGLYDALPLLLLGDDVTTDHISPAGAIPEDSEAGRWLVARGEDPADLNAFSARRGNWEVMLRGLFTNKGARNLLADIPPGCGLDPETGDVLPLHALASRLRARGRAAVLVAGHRYGAGSSRDWAAKGPALLGVRAVLARSFERIHRTNLIGMGILPLRLPQALALAPGDLVRVEAASVAPRAPVPVAVLRRDGAREPLVARAEVETALEADLLRQGGMVPFILARAGAGGADAAA